MSTRSRFFAHILSSNFGVDAMLEIERRVAKLKQLVMEAKNLQQPARCFDDELASHGPFLNQGTFRQHKPLCKLVRSTAASYGHPLEPGDDVFVHLPRYSMWHGPLGCLSGSMAVVIYFDDIQRGIASIGKVIEPETHYIRFSLPRELADPDRELGELEVAGVSVGPRGVA